MKKKSILSLLFVLIMFISFLYPSKVYAASLNKTSTTIVIDEVKKLTVNGTSKKVKWSTTNKKIATVSKSGYVTGKKAGTCYIKAKVGKKTYKCKITVIGPKKVAKLVARYVHWTYPSSSLLEWDRKGRYEYVYIAKPQGDGAPTMKVKVNLRSGKAYFQDCREEFFEKLPKSTVLWK